MSDTASVSSNKNVDSLISDISKLMAEAEGMLSESSSHAEEHPALFRERREALEPGLAARYAAMAAKIAELSRRTDLAIRSHPYEAAAVALGFGALLGVFAGRRRLELS